jgi:hypothetical protein
MKAKHLFLAIAALLVAVGTWLGWAAWRTDRQSVTSESSTNMDVGSGLPDGRPTPPHLLRPPNPNRRFEDLTPEQRVQRARKGPVGG